MPVRPTIAQTGRKMAADIGEQDVFGFIFPILKLFKQNPSHESPIAAIGLWGMQPSAVRLSKASQ